MGAGGRRGAEALRAGDIGRAKLRFGVDRPVRCRHSASPRSRTSACVWCIAWEVRRCVGCWVASAAAPVSVSGGSKGVVAQPFVAAGPGRRCAARDPFSAVLPEPHGIGAGRAALVSGVWKTGKKTSLCPVQKHGP